jgi:hypothetical protein
MAREGWRKGQSRSGIGKDLHSMGDGGAYSGEGSCAEETEDAKAGQRAKQG